MEILSGLLLSSLQRALFAARDRQHAFLEPEHLLQALIDDEDARAALTGCDADLGQLRHEIATHLDQLPSVAKLESERLPLTGMATQQAVQEAVTRMQLASRPTTTGADVLLSLASHPDWLATRILRNQGGSYWVSGCWLAGEWLAVPTSF